MGTVRKNVKTPLKALNEEVLVTTFTLLLTVPVLPFKIFRLMKNEIEKLHEI